MSSTIGRREFVLAQRAAFVEGVFYAGGGLVGAHLMSAKNYPIAQVERPRVVTRDARTPGYEIRFSLIDGRLKYVFGGRGHTETPVHDYVEEAPRIKRLAEDAKAFLSAYAELVQSPTELVDAE